VSDAIERLKAEFLSETEDTLAHLQRDLNALGDPEAAAAPPPDVVDRVFRTTHSLKGVAGMFGLDAMSSVAHAMENILDGLRERRLTLDRALLDLLHRGHEALHGLLAAATGDDAAARATGQAVIDDVSAALRPPAGPDGEGGSVIERVLARVSAEEAAGIRRAAAAGRVVAVLEIDLPEDGFEVPLRELFTAIRGWGTVHATVAAGRDPARRTFRASAVASGDQDAFALIRSVTPLGARVLLEDVPAAAAAPAAEPGLRVPEAAPAAPPAARADAFLRVPLERVDRLVAELAEVVQAKGRLEEAVARVLEGSDRTRATLVRQAMRGLDRRLRLLRDGALGIRTVRLEPLFGKLERVFREACRHAGKDARFVAEGAATELDKSAAEALSEPLVHLVRNAVDHGLETSARRVAAGKDRRGTVRVCAATEGNAAVLEVSDDGAGVDFERVLAKARRLGLVGETEAAPRAKLLDALFHPGLTVKDEPTGLSGRGVGLDVVRDSLARIGGLLEIDTGPQGTTFRLRVPTSLAVLTALEVEAGGQSYYVPLPNVVRALDVDPARVRQVRGEEMVDLDGEPVVAREIAARPGPRGASGRLRRPAVLLAVADRRALLWVDRLGRQRDVTVRSLGELLPCVPGVAGCAETADGRTVLVLDPSSLLDAPLAAGTSS
jgi:two-component system chemotaxis sensor kinase CheA